VTAILAGGVCLGLGLLVAWLRGGNTWHTVAVVYYIAGAAATLAAVGVRGMPLAGYATYENSSAVRAGNAARAMNLVIGVVLLGLGVLIDTLTR
jgi:hypothetical protein